MKTIKSIYHSAFAYMLLSLLFNACQDTNSFEKVRQLKTGMTITDCEQLMGDPIIYERINDTVESRSYLYDNAGNGIDIKIEVIFSKDKAISINN